MARNPMHARQSRDITAALGLHDECDGDAELTDCQACRRWLDESHNRRHNFVDKMIKAARAGCLYCQFFHELIKLKFPSALTPDGSTAKSNTSVLFLTIPLGFYTIEGTESLAEPNFPFSLHYKTDDARAVEGTKSCELWNAWTSTSPEPSAATFQDIFFSGVSLAVAESSASEVAFERARAWLSHCVGNHPRCRAGRDPNLTGPRRLLRVSAATAPFPQVQLIDFDGSKTRPDYACLSYSWGTDLEGVLTTNRKNLDQHLSGICEENLPGTIKDAVRVCRELGIHYLWVDSLCIIQQDELDFAIEGSKMHTIYDNSHLTIYAKHTSSCKDGFLGPQCRWDPEWQYQAPFPSIPKGSPFFIRRDRPFRRPFPLDSRGWCLQESILPSRQLIYTDEEMVWRCNTHGLCECGHLVGIEAHPDRSDGRYASHFLENAQEVSGRQRSTKEWEITIQEYSKRLLTNPQDKLAAIAGLARRHLLASSSFGADYFAGLLKEGLPDQLLWTQDIPSFSKDAFGNRLLNGAPTWSWGSVQVEIRFPRFSQPSDHFTARIDSISCVPLHHQNPLGPVKSGRLVLTAPVLPVRLAFRCVPTGSPSTGRPAIVVSHRDEDCPLYTDSTLSPDIQLPRSGDQYCKQMPRKAYPSEHGCCNCGLLLSPKQYLACGLKRCTRGAYAVEWMYFLLLEMTPDEGTYHRVGMFSGDILRTMDGEDVGGGDGTERLFFNSLPRESDWPGKDHGLPTCSLDSPEGFEPWPTRIELEWKQITII
ncbi:heterokaryon incompatibility protein-domain-containing protein [Podospora conica]|nr:heterokaryon incompatibility protein-domain-containing protein [Schizothecium conicum]